MPLPPSAIDADMPDCCVREIESNRRIVTLEAELRAHDRVAEAERRRAIHLLKNMTFGSGCRCCYGEEDGGEYEMLANLREDAEERGVRDAEVSSKCEVASQHSIDESDDDEFDYLLDEVEEDTGLGGFEEERRREIKESIMHLESLQQHGYGVHRQMHPTRVLHSAGIGMEMFKANGAVIHLYDPDAFASAKLDLLLEGNTFAGEYRGTKFLRSNGRSVLLMNQGAVSNQLRTATGADINVDSDLPCVMAVKSGEIVAISPSLRAFVHGKIASEDVSIDERALEDWLDRAGVLFRTPPSFDELCRIRPEEDALYAGSAVVRDEPEYYDCGVSGCEKTFNHTHVGIANDRQDGCVIDPQNAVSS